MGMYKFTLGKIVTKAIQELNLGPRSLISAGVTKSKYKIKQTNIVFVAAKKITEAISFKRQACVSHLMLYGNKMKSFAQGVLSTISLQDKEKDKEVSLLGMQCHHKSSEPYFPSVSYRNGVGYDYMDEKNIKAYFQRRTNLLRRMV